MMFDSRPFAKVNTETLRDYVKHGSRMNALEAATRAAGFVNFADHGHECVAETTLEIARAFEAYLNGRLD